MGPAKYVAIALDPLITRVLPRYQPAQFGFGAAGEACAIVAG
jgi:hypothetical protein